ncbi:MAG: glycosyltransferase family 4 protein [Lentisphaerota bacterium]
MSRENRILFVSATSGFFGGVERYIYDSARLLSENGFEVSGLFEHADGRESDAFLETFRKVYSPGDVDAFDGSEFDIAFIHKVEDPELLKEIRRKFITIVFIHDHDYYCLRRHKYFPVRRINCHLPFNPVYCSICCGLIERQNNRFKFINLFRRIALMREVRKCTAFAVISAYMRNNLLINGFNIKSIYKLYPFKHLKDSVFKQEHKDMTPVILYVGQLVRGKGVDLLLAALAKIDIDFKAYIVGGNNDEGYLKEMSSALGLDDKVFFTGWQSNPAEYFEKADVVAFPSRWQEPFGLVGIEAFSFRKPVVAFDVGGVSEWLTDNHTGILVKEKDINGMAEGLKRLLQNKALADKFGNNGYDFVSKHCSSENFIAGFKVMIEDVMIINKAKPHV